MSLDALNLSLFRLARCDFRVYNKYKPWHTEPRRTKRRRTFKSSWDDREWTLIHLGSFRTPPNRSSGMKTTRIESLCVLLGNRSGKWSRSIFSKPQHPRKKVQKQIHHIIMVLNRSALRTGGFHVGWKFLLDFVRNRTKTTPKTVRIV